MILPQTIKCNNLSLSEVNRRPGEIRGLAVSSQGISVVPVDGGFRPLYNAISWLDLRAERELEEILKKFDRAWLYGVTGKRASAAYTLPKLLWIRKNLPDIYRRARYFLLPHDFIAAKLTGLAVTDHTLASGTMLYDLSKADWSDELCGAFSIDRERLPEIRWGGEPAGTLTAEAANRLGLPFGISVAAGGQDQKCASFAAGLAEGIATVSLGASAAVEMLNGTGAGGVIPRFAYFSPGESVSEGVVNAAGIALRWLRDTCFPGYSYRDLDDLAEQSLGKSRVLFHPFLSGEGSPGWRQDAQAGFSRVTLSTVPGDLVCAVMEGVAFEVYRNLTVMGAEPDTELRAFGGGAKSALWHRILASVAGMPVRGMSTPEAACLGAALLAARACAGSQTEIPAPAETGAPVLPEQGLTEFYRDKFADYMRVYNTAQSLLINI